MKELSAWNHGFWKSLMDVFAGGRAQQFVQFLVLVFELDCACLFEPDVFLRLANYSWEGSENCVFFSLSGFIQDRCDLRLGIFFETS